MSCNCNSCITIDIASLSECATRMAATARVLAADPSAVKEWANVLYDIRLDAQRIEKRLMRMTERLT